MKTKSIFPALLICSTLIFSSCEDTDKNGRKLDTPTAGNIQIAVDEALQPLCDVELETFHALYKRAHVKPLYLPEGAAMQLFLDDSVRVIMLSRELNEKEKQFFKDKKHPVQTTKVAYDAVALIVNNDNADSTLTLQQLADVLRGKTKTWNEIHSSFAKEKIQVVFDNSQSGTLNYMRQRFQLNQDSLPENFYALKTNPEVLKYVEKNKSALGIIGVSWISDREDSTTINFMQNIKVLALSPPDSITDADEAFYQPYQAYIAQRYYPLVREVFMISSEARSGLGTGFVSFVAGTKGQTIIRLTGLLPATMPVRLISVKKKF